MTPTDRPRPPECPMRAALDPWLDDELDPDARAAFEVHTETCLPCRKAQEDALRVRQWARGLPPELTPQRDLWAEVEAVISPRASDSTTNDRPAAPSVRKVPWTWAAAAAILLSTGTSLATAAWMRTPGGPVGSTPIVAQADGNDVTGDPDPVAGWEAEVREATAELSAALEARRNALDPETLAVVENNLAIIDRAIAETRAALSRDPADDRARGALVAAYNQKIRVLQRTLRLPAT